MDELERILAAAERSLAAGDSPEEVNAKIQQLTGGEVEGLDRLRLQVTMAGQMGGAPSAAGRPSAPHAGPRRSPAEILAAAERSLAAGDTPEEVDQKIATLTGGQITKLSNLRRAVEGDGPLNLPGPVRAGVVGAAEIPTFGLLDEIAGFFGGAKQSLSQIPAFLRDPTSTDVDLSPDFPGHTQDAREVQAGLRQQFPLSTGAGNVAGAVGTLGVGGAGAGSLAARQLATRAPSIATGATRLGSAASTGRGVLPLARAGGAAFAGAGEGAAFQLGSSEGSLPERVADLFSTEGLLATGLGAVGGVGGAMAGRVARRQRPRGLLEIQEDVRGVVPGSALGEDVMERTFQRAGVVDDLGNRTTGRMLFATDDLGEIRRTIDKLADAEDAQQLLRRELAEAVLQDAGGGDPLEIARKLVHPDRMARLRIAVNDPAAFERVTRPLRDANTQRQAREALKAIAKLVGIGAAVTGGVGAASNLFDFGGGE